MLKSLHLSFLMLAFLIAPGLTIAAEQDLIGGAIVVSDAVSAKVTIVDINKKDRELTLRDEDGVETTMIAGEKVRNFDQIKKGDIVEIEFFRAATTALEKLSDTNIASETTDVVRAPAGEKPGGAAMHTSSIVATVLEIDTGKRLLTVQGPRGRVVVLTVPAEMTLFDSLKKGDKISAVLTEAIAIEVRSPEMKK